MTIDLLKDPLALFTTAAIEAADLVVEVDEDYVRGLHSSPLCFDGATIGRRCWLIYPIFCCHRFRQP